MTTTTAIQIHPTSKQFNRVSKAGKVLGTRIEFGQGTFKTWRESLKASGLTGKEAKARINEAIRDGQGSLRWAQFQVAAEGLRRVGMVPDLVDTSKGSAVARFTLVPKAPEPKAVESGKVTQEQAMEVLGLTAEDLATLKALLGK